MVARSGMNDKSSLRTQEHFDVPWLEVDLSRDAVHPLNHDRPWLASPVITVNVQDAGRQIGNGIENQVGMKWHSDEDHSCLASQSQKVPHISAAASLPRYYMRLDPIRMHGQTRAILIHSQSVTVMPRQNGEVLRVRVRVKVEGEGEGEGGSGWQGQDCEQVVGGGW